MTKIARLLAQRNDLSTFVVHFTRGDWEDARENLVSILESEKIEARNAFGSAVGALRKANLTNCLSSQRTVCFTETPLEHVNLFLEPISDLNRKCKFAPYGIALTKRIARNQGVNPIWYVDITKKTGNPIMRSTNAMIEAAISEVVDERARGNAKASFSQYEVSNLAPFVEQMGTGPTFKKEFWWEREWRHLGDFHLPHQFLVIAPEAEHKRFEAITKDWTRKPRVIDATWGLEGIIGRLAGFRPNEIAPF